MNITSVVSANITSGLPDICSNAALAPISLSSNQCQLVPLPDSAALMPCLCRDARKYLSFPRSVLCPTTTKSASSAPFVNSTGISSTSSHRGAPFQPPNPRGGRCEETSEAPSRDRRTRRCSEYALPSRETSAPNATRPSVATVATYAPTDSGGFRRAPDASDRSPCVDDRFEGDGDGGRRERRRSATGTREIRETSLVASGRGIERRRAGPSPRPEGVGTSATRFLGAHEDSVPMGCSGDRGGRTGGRARDAPAILRSRWRCPPSRGSCALPRAACSGLGTPPALRASASHAGGEACPRVAVTKARISGFVCDSV